MADETPNLDLNKILNEHARFLEGELVRMIAKKKMKGTELAGSIGSEVTANDGAWTGKHALRFKTSGRFVDMGVGRMRKIQTAETNGALISAKKRRPKKWYSKTSYGIVFGRLVPQLVVNMQENTLEGIKAPLQAYQKEMIAKYGSNWK